MLRSRRIPHIGITLGDPAGIGAEVTAAALRQPTVRRAARFTVIGDRVLFERHFPSRAQGITFVDLARLSPRDVRPGKPDRKGATASLAYVAAGAGLLKSGKISALVTAPLCKEMLSRFGSHFPGHTEYLAELFMAPDCEMMFVTPTLRVIVLTRHIALCEVPDRITAEKVLKTLHLADETLRRLFGIRSPRIAVCGLNPHAGEGGGMGDEEIRVISPAIRRAQRQGIRAAGPFAADTIFTSKNSAAYDVILAMYHDQGLIPVKTLHFREAVNLTIGLPFVRTSPAHGTAFDIAGKKLADASSMAAAIRLAAQLTRAAGRIS